MVLQTKGGYLLSFTIYKGNLFIFMNNSENKNYIKLYPDDVLKFLSLINVSLNTNKDFLNRKIKEGLYLSKKGNDFYISINSFGDVLDKYKLKVIQLYISNYLNNIALIDVLSNIQNNNNKIKTKSKINKEDISNVDIDLSNIINDISDIDDNENINDEDNLGIDDLLTGI